MPQRINYANAAPEGLKALQQLESYLRSTSLEPKLLELVKMRASQLNDCAYCLDMHSQDARAAGETEQRLYVLSAWHETPFFSDRERAALAWTEAITLVADNDVSDELYKLACEHFDEKELTDLTLAIIAINSWNRLSIAFRTPVGSERRGKAQRSSVRLRTACCAGGSCPPGCGTRY
jgi:AhpD family alkylhydroperoxidase